MMSKPDFMTKQILLIESDNSKKLKFRNSNLILIDEENKTLLQHSCHKIFVVFVVGEFSITSVLIKNAKKFAFPIVFLGFNLKPYFSVVPDNKGNFLLRKKQYMSKSDFEISKHIVKNKVMNQLFLMISLRYKTPQEKKAIAKIKFFIGSVEKVKNNNELLGIEGNASKLFFKVYFKNLDFNARRPRVRDDIFNLLFDIGYSYLFNFIEANLELYGFDIYYGFYHKLFYQRKSLVCDIIEPFRCIIDKKIKNGFNLKQIDEGNFDIKNSQYFVKREFNKKYSQFFLKEILKNKERIFLYVQQYYRSVMKGRDVKDFPVFSLEDAK